MMKRSLKNLLKNKNQVRLALLPACVLTLFFIGTICSPLNSSSASTMYGKRGANLYMVAKPLSPPPAPVGVNSLDDEIIIEGAGMRCGGGNCQSNFLWCTAAGSYIWAQGGCCAKCCWENDPDNCSSITCCSAP